VEKIVNEASHIDENASFPDGVLEAESAGKVAFVRQDEGYQPPLKGSISRFNVSFGDGARKFPHRLPLAGYGQRCKMPPFNEMLLFRGHQERKIPPRLR